MDSNDRERVGEAREELMRMLAEDELRDAVLLVFANKQVHFLKHHRASTSWIGEKKFSIPQNLKWAGP